MGWLLLFRRVAYAAWPGDPNTGNPDPPPGRPWTTRDREYAYHFRTREEAEADMANWGDKDSDEFEVIDARSPLEMLADVGGGDNVADGSGE